MGHARFKARREYRIGLDGDVTRTYRMPPELVRALDETCERHSVYPSHLVCALLREGLRAIDRGDLVLDLVPIAQEVRIRRKPQGE